MHRVALLRRRSSHLAAFSIPPLERVIPLFAFFGNIGNFVELRMFSELLPLLTAALTFIAPTSQTQTPERA